MLYLKPPYYLIEDVAVFPDHDNASQFYFLPRGPRFASDAPNFDLQLLRFVSRDTSGPEGGFLTFEVDLGIDETTRGKVVKKIQDEKKLTSVRLDPLPVIDGTVDLVLFDNKTQGGARLVQSSYAAKPSLYGANKAMFSVQLTPAGVQLVDATLDGEVSSIGVLYSLQAVGLTPGYKIVAKANWKSVYTHFVDTSTKGAWIFYSDTVRKEVENLITTSVIKIDVDSYLEDPKDMTRRDAIVGQVTDLVLNKFFQPLQADKKKDAEGGGGGGGGIFGSIGSLFGGTTVGYKVNSESTERTSEASLSIEVNERVSVKRTFNPNGFLTAQKGTERIRTDRRSVTIGLDPFFTRRKMRVQSNMDFDNISRIQVDIQYGDFPVESVMLDKPDAVVDRDWPRVTRGADEVTLGYTVFFKPDSELDSRRPRSIERKETQGVRGTIFTISPTETMFLQRPVSIEADSNFPWSTYTSVKVNVKYGSGSVRYEKLFVLDKNAPKKSFKYFSLDPRLMEYEAEISYQLAGGGEIKLPPRKMESEFVAISDPRPVPRKIVFDGADVDWKAFKKITVDLTYEDRANSISIKQSIPIEDAKKKAEVLLRIADSSKPSVTYSLTPVTKAGVPKKAITGGIARGEDVSLTTLDAQDKPVVAVLRTIDIALDGDIPAGSDYEKIKIMVKASDKSVVEQAETFGRDRSSGAAVDEFTYFFSSTPAYQYRIEYINKKNQLQRSIPRTGFNESSEAQLTVPVKP